MKFKVKSKEDGYNVKRAIFDLERECQYLTLYFVKDQTVEHIPIPDDLDYVWDIHKLRESKKARVRYSKKEGAWYLYLPEPEYRPENIYPRESMDADDIFLDKLFDMCKKVLTMREMMSRRKCMVWRKSNKKGVLVDEFPCWCTDKMINPVVKDGVHIANDLLYICEFQDGHIERVRYNHIRFVEEWE